MGCPWAAHGLPVACIGCPFVAFGHHQGAWWVLQAATFMLPGVSLDG